jgi:hypothetical protein
LSFGELRESFDEEAAGGATERTVAVAGRPARLVFADERLLAAFLPALQHLEVETDGEPWLTVRLWSGPGPSGVLTDYSADRREVLLRIANPDAIGWHVRAAPFGWMFGQACSDAGIPLVHAGAVGRPGAGVLLAGPSGSGKSLTALACAAAGLDYVGDDHVLVSPGQEPAAHSVSCMGRVLRRDLERIPGVAGAVSGWSSLPDDKGAVDVLRLAAGRVRKRLPLAAIVIPRVSAPGPTRLRRTSAGEALRAIAPSTLFQLPAQEPRSAMSAMAELVRTLPVYELELGGAPADAARELELLCAHA